MKICGFLFLLTLLFLNINDIIASTRSKRNKAVVCYVGSWAIYRPGNGKFSIDNIQPKLCTHLVYTFAGLNITTWTIKSLDPFLDIENNNGNYRKMTRLRKKYPGLNVLLAVGGWNEGSKNYSDLASSPTRRSQFIDSVVHYLGEYGFNGLDLDWEFPGARGGVPADKKNFVYLVKELKEAFRESNYLLTAAISADKKNLEAGYDLPELSKYLDHIHVMAYDYHGTWNNKVLPNAPMRGSYGIGVEDSLQYLLDGGVPSDKLVLGLPMYGRTYILTSKLNSSKESPIGHPCMSEGFEGPYTKQTGFMGYNEICKELVSPNKWRTGWDNESDTPYAIKDDHVIVYDNPMSLKAKVEYAEKMNLAGVMIWSIDTDDFNGECISLKDSLDKQTGTYPLLRSINIVLDPNSGSSKGGASKTRSYSFILILAMFLMYRI